MAYTGKILTSSEYAALEGTTEFKELFTSSKAHLNSDTFAYSMFKNKVTEVQSYDDDFMADFWYRQFFGYVNRADEGTKARIGPRLAPETISKHRSPHSSKSL